MQTDRQAGRKADSQTDGQTLSDRQTGRKAYRLSGRRADTQKERQAGR